MTDSKKPNKDLLEGQVRSFGKRITGLEERVGGAEEHVDFDRITERQIIVSPPRPTPRSQVAAPPALPAHPSTGAMRAVSESQQSFDKTMIAVATHLAIRDKAEDLRDADFARALALVARDQGLEDELPERIAASLPPPAADGRTSKRTPRTLAARTRRIDRRTLASLIFATVLALLELEDRAERLIDRLKPPTHTEGNPRP